MRPLRLVVALAVVVGAVLSSAAPVPAGEPDEPGRLLLLSLPGVTWDGSVATLEGMGRAAWFKDSEGNIMCIDEVR